MKVKKPAHLFNQRKNLVALLTHLNFSFNLNEEAYARKDFSLGFYEVFLAIVVEMKSLDQSDMIGKESLGSLNL